MWEVSIDKAVTKKLSKIPNPDKKRITEAILSLENGTEGLDIKPLVGREGYRLRVGDWRIILDIDENNRVISAYTLGARGDVYK